MILRTIEHNLKLQTAFVPHHEISAPNFLQKFSTDLLKSVWKHLIRDR